MQDEELDYVSSSELVTAGVDVVPQDEEDLPTIVKVSLMLDAQIASYSSIDRLTVSEKDFTVAQQLAVSKSVQNHLIELKALVDLTIGNIKEKYSNGK